MTTEAEQAINNLDQAREKLRAMIEDFDREQEAFRNRWKRPGKFRFQLTQDWPISMGHVIPAGTILDANRPEWNGIPLRLPFPIECMALDADAAVRFRFGIRRIAIASKLWKE